MTHYTKNLYEKELREIDTTIAKLIDQIDNLGISDSDKNHCTKVLSDLYDDLEIMTETYL